MITSEQIRAARAILRMEQRKLASLSGVSVETIKRLEAKPGALSAYASTVESLVVALESAGVIFVEENGHGPGVRLRKRPPTRPDQPIESATGDEETDLARIELRDLQNRR